MHIAENTLKVTLCATDSQGLVTLFAGPGIDPGTVVGTPIFDLYKDHPDTIAIIRRTLAGEPLTSIVQAHGRTFDTRFTPVRDGNGAISGLIGVIIDVTEPLAFRQALDKERMERTQLESLAVRAGNIAHDFNNLLTGILGNLSLAQMEADPGSTLAVSLTEAERACLRTRDMVAELGAVSEQGKSAKMVVSIEKCIRQAVQSAAFGPEIRCGVRIDPGLWSVLVDEPQISQVLQTLLVNARQAMPAAGIVEIDTWNTRAAETLRPARYVAIRVTDHGPGVPRDQLNRIFEPDFTARQGGLVLATAHAIVANHGGTLVADSHGSSGLSFTIYLPASVTAASKPIPEPAPPKENHARILVMDDEQSIRELTGRMLSSVGFQVDTAEEGGDALRQYREAMEGGKPFDAVLLDLRVPLGMGGFEAFQAIRGLNPAVKAIISSGHAENPIMTNYRQHGIAAVVPKPYNVNELVTAVRQTVGSP